MCRNRKILAVLLGLALTTSLAGCGSSGSLVTDTGSGKQQEIPIEEYLNTDALNQEEQVADDLYQVLTLEKGSFEEPALKQILKRSYLNVPTVQLSMEGIKGTFGEYVAEFMQYVEVGDVIATIRTEVDEIAIEEVRLRLQRLQERCEAAQLKAFEDLQELGELGNSIGGEYEKEAHRLRVQQRQLDWEHERDNFERQIAEAREELQKLTQVGEIYEVKATEEGFVNYNYRYRAGEEIEDGDYICHILNSTEVYTTTNNQADLFHYGMEMSFDNVNGNTPSTVVNGGSWILYGNLDTGNAIFRLDFEQDVSTVNAGGLNSLTLVGNVTSMEDVIVIPKAAVTEEDSEYYVTVLKEDGSLLKTEFIPGGSNIESYWVLEGLTEGMQIVYN